MSDFNLKAIVPSDDRNIKISTRRLVIYDRSDMVKCFFNKHGRNPSNETDLLEGLVKSDIEKLPQHFSLIDFLQLGSLNKCTKDNDFFCNDKNSDGKFIDKIYLQGGCTSGVNLFYLLNQCPKPGGKVNYYKSALIKVFCRSVSNSDTDLNKSYSFYYVNRNYVKVLHLNKGTAEDINTVLHGNDMTYINGLKITNNQEQVVSEDSIIVCNKQLIMVVNPHTMEVVNNTMYFKGLWNYKYDTVRNTLYKPDDWNEDVKGIYNNVFGLSGITYDDKSKILFVNYYLGKSHRVGYYRLVTTSVRYDDSRRFIELKSVNLNNDLWTDGKKYDILDFDSEGYDTVGGICNYSRNLFQTRCSRKDNAKNSDFLYNKVFQFEPVYKEGEIDKFKLRRSFDVLNGKFIYAEIENILYKIISNSKVRFFLGFKVYNNDSENVYGTIMYFDYDVEKLKGK